MGHVPASFSPDLWAAAVRAARRADHCGRPVPIAVRFPIPAQPAFPPLASEDEAFRFEEPARGFAIRSQGAALAFETDGPERFARLTADLERLRAELALVDTVSGSAARPALVGGFAFDSTAGGEGIWSGFPACRFVLPRRMSVWYGQRGFEQRAALIAPGEGPGPALVQLVSAPRRAEPEGGPAPGPLALGEGDADYLARVEQAVAAVRRGDLEKVVVARSLHCRAAVNFDADAVVESLRRRHPRCRIFAIARGDAAFVGASPERLVRAVGGRVRADALAGSAPRGTDPDDDARLARALLESKKEQEEHAFVVRALREALVPLCHSLRIGEAPRVRRLAGIQHLHTPAEGTLRDGIRAPLLALAQRIHPTPAVSGAPGAAARAWLHAHEGLARGWYAGGVGWMDLAGDGELAVSLRSTLLRGREAHLFAGAGVVADSDPHAELRETRLKLDAARRALCGETS